MSDLHQESIFLPYRNGHLHIRKIESANTNAANPVLMLHGSMSNGRVFYTKSGKGLGCFLARRGHPVYILDVFGNGQSEPRIQGGESYGQSEVINEQIPLIHDYIMAQHHQAMHWVGHSWGTILMASHYARYPQRQHQVITLSGFASKKTIYSQHPKKPLYVNLVWNRICPWLTKRYGFLPAQRFKLGMDNETTQSLLDNVKWVNGQPWKDRDGFCYQSAARKTAWPATWFLAGKADHVLGNPADVKAFLKDSCNHTAKFTLLSKKNGNRHDYDHTSLLVHPDAMADHLPEFAQWLSRHNC
ncbi:alpha/beta fold hydrolase [Echinimonas agarilytica]|uniref:Alpha/beta fold hydrolase n=1 Tax=Echinimonas agarilytica TaxID=1215918 RepID=A0AA41W564_9GAMM|nr:alpha/beta hydrolase [Echinimonas agarilytica]MCM2678884.1 alpha/beta fold hydrolase [Echinimonas agarilytica]